MGRFSASKIHPLAEPEKANRAHNQLIDLLDKAYTAELSVDGKKIVVEISPTKGFEITIDGVKVAGIDTDGNLFISRIADPDDLMRYITLGAESGWVGLLFWDKYVSTVYPYFGLLENANLGINWYDKNGVVRMEVNPKLPAYDPNGYFRIYDGEGLSALRVSPLSVQVFNRYFRCADSYIQAGDSGNPQNMIAGGFVGYSNYDSKENIEKYNLDEAYEKIKTFNIYKYNYIGDPFKRLHIGTTYEEAPKEIAYTDIDDDNFGIDTGNATFLTMAVVRKLQEKVETLEQRIKDLEARLDASV